MLTSNDIAKQRFDHAAFGGYKNDEVDAFLNEVANSFEELEEQNAVLLKKLEVLAEKLEEYRSDEESLRSALLSAQKLGDSVVRESKAKAELIIREANGKAERLIAGAHDQVEKEKLVYVRLQKDVASFKSKLLATYKQHLELISSLPDQINKEKAQAAAEKASESATAKEPEPTEEKQEAVSEEEAQATDFTARPEPKEGDYAEHDYEEPAPKAAKDSLSHRDTEEIVKKSPYADEYYEDFSDDEEGHGDGAPSSSNKKKSKFGTLKFGAGYDLKRE